MIKKVVLNTSMMLCIMVSFFFESKAQSKLDNQNKFSPIQKTSSLKLKYSFVNSYPYKIKVKGKNIYLADDKNIYKFTINGEFIAKIQTPNIKKENPIADFDVLIDSKGKETFYTFNYLVIFVFDETKIKNTFDVGDLPGYKTYAIDSLGNVYILFSRFEGAQLDSSSTRIKIFTLNNKSIELKTPKNLVSLNFVINKNEILSASSLDFALHNLNFENDSIICKSFPLKEIKSKNNSMQFIRTLGKYNGNYFFIGTDGYEEKDYIFKYDCNLKFVYSYDINESLKDLRTDNTRNIIDYQDNPTKFFGTLNNGKIYYLRNTKEGSIIKILDPN